MNKINANNQHGVFSINSVNTTTTIIVPYMCEAFGEGKGFFWILITIRSVTRPRVVVAWYTVLEVHIVCVWGGGGEESLSYIVSVIFMIFRSFNRDYLDRKSSYMN